MLTARATFETKVDEIEEYYKFLRYAVIDDSRLHCPSKRSRKETIIDAELKKILKANCFLLLYNLVESSIRSVINDLYDAIRQDGLSYTEIAREIRKFWIHQRYRLVGPSAHPDKYRDLARELIDAVVTKAALDFDSNQLPIAGNIDADRIRKIYQDLGLTIQAHKSARGGEKLVTIREMRNKLAHGLESFSECGRDYTFEDLNQIKSESFIYLRGVMRAMDNYISSRKYCA